MRTPPGPLAITPGAARARGDVRALLGRLEAAFAAGLPAVSLREYALSDALLLELAREALALAAPTGAWVGVHDALHVALAAGAHGAHVGRRALPPAAARSVADGRLALGLSTHAHDDPAGAAVGAADYVTFGPVRAPRSKPGDAVPTGFDALARFARAAGRPVFALGGLGPEDVAAVHAAGAELAAIDAVFGGADVAANVAALRAAAEARP